MTPERWFWIAALIGLLLHVARYAWHHRSEAATWRHEHAVGQRVIRRKLRRYRRKRPTMFEVAHPRHRR